MPKHGKKLKINIKGNKIIKAYKTKINTIIELRSTSS